MATLSDACKQIDMQSPIRIYVAGGGGQNTSQTLIHLQSIPHFHIVCGRLGRKHNADDSLDSARDLSVLERCDVFLALFDNDTLPYRGTFTEMGFCLGRSIPVITVGSATSREGGKPYAYNTNPYYWHPKVIRTSSIGEALSSISVTRIPTGFDPLEIATYSDAPDSVTE